MSPRPKRLRKVSNPPVISGFKPYGNKSIEVKPVSVFLQYEEYEALRLCDFEMLNHHQASVMMDVSRPTLTRIYAKARYKIAEAIVKGKQIIIEGGKVYFDSEWFACPSCGCFFNNPEKQEDVKSCPLCRSTNFSNYKQLPDEEEYLHQRCYDICICPQCGFEQEHQLGKPCSSEICPQCKTALCKKGSPQSRKFKNQ
ncbi:MAG: DUF134 domain-containing protein [Bacteroidetes bacterium]|nr:DUF134 domain-containing protein [Bacteroidota bacterium]